MKRSKVLAWNAALLAFASATFSAQAGITGLDFIGEATFATGFEFAGTEVGGLSGITYDAATNTFYSISDDQSNVNNARFYTLSIDLSDGALNNGDVTFTAVTTLLAPATAPAPFPPGEVNPEDIAFSSTTGTLFISSEGRAFTPVIDPFVNEFALTGQEVSALPVPSKFLPPGDGSSGIRNNLAFESVTLTPDGVTLFTATENALEQDGPAADVGVSSPARVIQYDLTSGSATAEYVYVVDPVANEPVPPDQFRTNGLSAMLALSDTQFLALEREFAVGVGNSAQIYHASIAGATDVSGDTALPAAFDPILKTILIDLDNLPITIDNLEGLSFGPILPDGRRSLIMVSDNNFNPSQFTQFLAFAVNESIPEPTTLALLGVGLAGLGFTRRRKQAA